MFHLNMTTVFPADIVDVSAVSEHGWLALIRLDPTSVGCAKRRRHRAGPAPATATLKPHQKVYAIPAPPSHWLRLPAIETIGESAKSLSMRL